MYNATFYHCTSLSSIPSNLFCGNSGGFTAGVNNGHSLVQVYNRTFEDCTSITSIPTDLLCGTGGGFSYDGSSALTGKCP